MSDKQIKTIRVTVDKSHLLTLGERMYVESIELIRELVNNAYDADATEVYIKILPIKIVVEDDGSGMDEKGLTQFFRVGSPFKRKESISPKFGRKRIGQFGIGKFSALSAAEEFVVESKKRGKQYSVVFNRGDWQKTDKWELPIRKEVASPLILDGTRVVLNKLKKKFRSADLERYLKETVPIRARKFAVFLNNKRITRGFIPGKKIPIYHKTMYGNIEGEIIIAANPRLVKFPGLECRVKQVMIKRSLLEINPWQHGVEQITGWVNADFLEITSARTDFIKDNPKYKLFVQVIKSDLEKVLKDLKKEVDLRSKKKIKEALEDVLDKIREALKANPDLTPSGRIIARRKEKAEAQNIASAELRKSAIKTSQEDEKPQKQEKEKKPKVDIEPTIAKRMRLKKLGITCNIAHLGEKGPEVISSGNIVYINQDHPLYLELYSKKDKLALHLLRLITQEIVMMKRTRLSAKDAFEMQSKLLTDAIVEKHLS